MKAVGAPELPETLITTFVGEGAAKLIERCLGARQERHADAMTAWRAHYAAHLLDTTQLYDGVAATLARLREPLAVLSNKPEGMSRAILEGLGIARRFVAILGGDSLPEKKPHPAGIDALRQMTGASAAVLVGDSRIDVETAKAARIPCWAAAYGFTGREGLAAAGADEIFDAFPEVEGLAARG